MIYSEGVIRLGSKVSQKETGRLGIVIGYSPTTKRPLIYTCGDKIGHNSEANNKLLSSPDGVLMENYYRDGFLRGLFKNELHYSYSRELKYLDQVFEGVEGYTEFFMQLLLDRSIEGV